MKKRDYEKMIVRLEKKYRVRLTVMWIVFASVVVWLSFII